MNELEFTQIAATWMQQAIDADPSLPFRHARVEQSAAGSAKRRDLTLSDDGHRPLLTGEVKMPYRPDGHSPFRREVVDDARRKARRAKCGFCFTWNVNKLVLWPADPRAGVGAASGGGASDDFYEAWDVAAVYRPEQMRLEQTERAIRRFLPGFLRDAARHIAQGRPLARRRPDDRFVDALEAALDQPVLLTTDALAGVWQRRAEREQLRAWMRDEQGWQLADPDDERGVAEDLAHAARFANYALVNKLVFHEALVRRYPGDLFPAAVPDHLNTGDALRLHLEGMFARAREVTRDYETVFGTAGHGAVAPRIPFYADPAVAYWRQLVEQVHEFDFSKIDYEVIGAIFERLISPEERHKYGQYYTRAEVVDLMNAFALRTGRERVMDPACGGGTFLVRAYARKRELHPGGGHAERLGDLYGVDLSRFAAHLTTINLATRDLIDEQNYPQVARSDFFDVEPGRPLMNLPARVLAGGLGSGQTRPVDIPPLDAVVGNPPYVRQEDIASKKPQKGVTYPGTKEHYRRIAQRAAGGIKLSGRSDLHVYFWPHAAEFLHDGGYLCLLTSSQWLDVDYGFRLQEYLLRNFEVQAIFESVDEPWFVGARVATCATILRRQRDERLRMENVTRFVQLRRPIAEVLGHDGTTAGAMAAADRLRDAVLSATASFATSDLRLRLVPQGDLWNRGVALGRLVKGRPAAKPAKPDALAGRQGGDYFGGKWGQYVRAPDLWFDLLDRCGDRLVPLAQIAQVRFGVKSGNDGFFFPIDASAEVLERDGDPAAFEAEHGVARREVELGRVKVVRCGEKLGELRPLEASVLEPEVHNLKDVKGYAARPEDCRRLILLTGRRTADLPPHAAAYVKWGERNGWHEKSTTAARQTETRDWHDLSGHRRGAMFWSMMQQYRHVIPANDASLICNHNLFDVDARDGDEAAALNGVLNSSITILAKNVFGRPVGVEGNQKTEVIDVKMMLVPDVRRASAADRRRVAAAMDALKRRKPLNLISPREFHRTKHESKGENEKLAALSDAGELEQTDRRELDDAVLRLLGYGDAAERGRLLDALYDHLRRHFIEVRRKEEKANANKKRAKKKGGRGSPAAVAEAVVRQLRERSPGLFRRYPQAFVDAAVLAAMTTDTFEVPKQGEPELLDLLTGPVLRVSKGGKTLMEEPVASREQGELLVALIRDRVRGLVAVPHAAADCAASRERFASWIEERDDVVGRLLEQQTADEDLRDKARTVLLPLLMVPAGAGASTTPH